MLAWFTKNYIFEDGFERLLHLRTVFNELLHLKNGPERTTRNGPEQSTRMDRDDLLEWTGTNY